MQLDLVVLPLETIKTLQVQITEEFNDMEQTVRAENVALRQEWDDMESKYRKDTMSAIKWNKDEASMRKFVAELCSELPDMQLELDGPIIENVWKVIMCAKAIVLRMDTVEIEYKAKIEELEKRDPTMQLKATTKEITGLIAYRIKDTTHLLEIAMESWTSIEYIEAVEEVHE